MPRIPDDPKPDLPKCPRNGCSNPVLIASKPCSVCQAEMNIEAVIADRKRNPHIRGSFIEAFRSAEKKYFNTPQVLPDRKMASTGD